jgi:hypothetical protein
LGQTLIFGEWGRRDTAHENSSNLKEIKKKCQETKNTYN